MKKHIFFLSREARFYFRERHGRAFQKRKKMFSFFFIMREARFYFHGRHGHASRKHKTTCFLLFSLPRKARFCFRKRHGRTSWKWKNMFLFFLLQEPWICFHERRGRAPEKWKKTCFFLPWEAPSFRPVFLKKNSSKSINMGSSFENLDARNQTVKMVQDWKARFKR